jgi:hypothetical protein
VSFAIFSPLRKPKGKAAPAEKAMFLDDDQEKSTADRAVQEDR